MALCQRNRLMGSGLSPHWGASVRRCKKSSFGLLRLSIYAFASGLRKRSKKNYICSNSCYNHQYLAPDSKRLVLEGCPLGVTSSLMVSR